MNRHVESVMMLNLIVLLLSLSSASSEQQMGIPCLSGDWDVTLEDAIHFSDVVVTGIIRNEWEGDFGTYSARISLKYAYKYDKQISDQSFSSIHAHNFRYHPKAEIRFGQTAIFFLIRQQNTDLAVHCATSVMRLRTSYNGTLFNLLQHIRTVGQSDNMKKRQKVLPYPNPCDDVTLSGCSEHGSECSLINNNTETRCTCVTGFYGDGHNCTALNKEAEFSYCSECGVYSRCSSIDSDGVEMRYSDNSPKKITLAPDPIMKSTHGQTNSPTEEATNNPIKETNEPINGPTNKPTNKPIDNVIESTSGTTNGLTETTQGYLTEPTENPTIKTICSCSHFKCSEQLRGLSKVCGTDRNTYSSICHMRRTACERQQPIFMLYKGTCHEKTVKPCGGMDHPLYTTAGLVTCVSTPCPLRHFCHLTTNYSICCPVSTTFTHAPRTTPNPSTVEPPTDYPDGSGFSGYSDTEDDKGSGFTTNDNEFLYTI